MRLDQIWASVAPFLTQHYPWVVPIIAVLFPIAAVLRGISQLFGTYQAGQRVEHARDEDRYRAIVEQRDAAMRDLAGERSAHERTRQQADRAEDELRRIQQAERHHDQPDFRG
ncbi:hypothetical protein AA103196_2254 [Ameyamaea chiangmaiensis NBRC 103196]|nr:hypothetical protein AA103196_2254 [Ameyamaea chiangmaiensis NBRC 103196]